MKLLKLTLQNINSFEGIHEIDFENPQIKNAGIFAIVGPTGAGKSTILDAITIALYNEIPRFKHSSNESTKNVNKDHIEKYGAVVTTGQSSAAIDLIFQIKNSRYLIQWSIKKNRNNNWNNVSHTLINYDTGFAIATKNSEVIKNNEAIVGLTFEQFCKTVVLSQGKFAELIQAPKKVRYALLEEITGNSYFRKIGIKIYNEFDKLDKELNLHKNNLETYQNLLIQENEVDEIKTSINNSKLNLENLQKNLKANSAQFNILQQKTKLTETLIDSENKLLSNKKYIEDHKNLFEQLEQYHQLKSVIDVPNQLKDFDLQKLNTKKRLSDITEQLNEFERLKQNIKNELEKNFNQNFDKEKFQDIVKNLQKIQHDFEFCKRQIDESRKKIVPSWKEAVQIFPSLSDNNDIENKLQNLLKDLIEKQKLLTIDKTISIENFQQSLSEKLNVINKIKINKEKEHALTKELSTLNFRIDEIDVKINNCITLKSECNIKLAGLVSLIEAQKKLVDSLNIINVLSSERKQLQKDTPCPVCGSKSHPYIDDPIDENEFEIENIKLQTIENDFIKYTTLNEQYVKDINILEKEKNSILTLIQENKTLQEKLFDEINSMYIQYQLDESKTIDIHESDVQIQLNDITTFINIDREISLLNNVIEKYSTINELKENLQSIELSFLEISPQLTLEQVMDFMHQYFEYHEKEIQLQHEIKLLKQKYEGIETQVEQLIIKTNHFIKETIDTNEDITLLEKVSLLKDDYVNKYQNFKNTEKEIQEIEIKLNQIKEQLSQLNNQTDTKFNFDELKLIIEKQEYDRDQYLSDIAQLSEKLKQQEELESKIYNLKKSLKKYQESYESIATLNHLFGDRTGDKFNKLIQRKVFENLLNSTNIKLQNILPRYELVILEDVKDVDTLFVYDKYQGNQKRTITTLSGGETFIVALSMALALSDISSHQVKLDSLFIDEGFGMLDKDTLEMALNTIEKIQYQENKQIGIISHIDAVKERIVTKIEVEKFDTGFSKLSIKTS